MKRRAGGFALLFGKAALSIRPFSSFTNRHMTAPATQSPAPRPGILDIALYVGGRASAPGVAKSFKLSSNKSRFGPQPQGVAALRCRP